MLLLGRQFHYIWFGIGKKIENSYAVCMWMACVCVFSCISSFRFLSHATSCDVHSFIIKNTRLHQVALVDFICLFFFVCNSSNLFCDSLSCICVFVSFLRNFFPDLFLTSVILMLLFAFDAIYVSNTIFININFINVWEWN